MSIIEHPDADCVASIVVGLNGSLKHAASITVCGYEKHASMNFDDAFAAALRIISVLKYGEQETTTSANLKSSANVSTLEKFRWI